jgi:hypothetical protein
MEAALGANLDNLFRRIEDLQAIFRHAGVLHGSDASISGWLKLKHGLGLTE